MHFMVASRMGFKKLFEKLLAGWQSTTQSELKLWARFFKSSFTKLVEGKDKPENSAPVVLEGHTNLQKIVPNTAIGSWDPGSGIRNTHNCALVRGKKSGESESTF